MGVVKMVRVDGLLNDVDETTPVARRSIALAAPGPGVCTAGHRWMEHGL